MIVLAEVSREARKGEDFGEDAEDQTPPSCLTVLFELGSEGYSVEDDRTKEGREVAGCELGLRETNKGEGKESGFDSS